jgi:hypothetical protein
MIQVRFDDQSRSRLVLVYDVPEPEPVEVIDPRAASLLFSILSPQQTPTDVRNLIEPRRKPVRRRKPRAARPH